MDCSDHSNEDSCCGTGSDSDLESEAEEETDFVSLISIRFVLLVSFRFALPSIILFY